MLQKLNECRGSLICLSCLMHFMPFMQVKLDTHAVEQDQGDGGKRQGLLPKPPAYPNYCN